MRYWWVNQNQTYHLFDRGFIGFDDNGQTIVSPVAHQESLSRMGLDPQHPPQVGSFSTGQRKYLAFHRENVLLMSRRSEEHTSELQSLMRISYAVFCLNKKKYSQDTDNNSSSKKHIYDEENIFRPT